MAWSNQALYQCAVELQNYPISFNIAAGSDPNEAHLEGGGYHCYFDRLPGGDYSGGGTGGGRSPRDLNGPPHKSAAWDLGFNAQDMVAVTQRLLAAANDGTLDRLGVREFNGWLGGDSRPINRDALLGWRQNYTPDDSHKSHVHIAWFRDVADNYAVISGIVGVITGTDSHGTSGGNATPIEEDDMPLNDADIEKVADAVELRLRQQFAPSGEVAGRVRQAVTAVLLGQFSGPGKTLFDRVRQAVGTVMDLNAKAQEAKASADAAQATTDVAADQGGTFGKSSD